MGVLRRVLADEKGTEMLEQVALLAFIILPLLSILLAFRTAVTKKFTDAWNDLKNA